MSHILIVDDEQSICWGLNKLVRSLGHTSAIASSAEQAFSAASSLRPDAIVLDVRLPGMDGFSAMRDSAPVRPGSNYHHHRLRRSGHGGRGRPQRGLRVPRETVRPERGPTRDSSGVETPDRSSPPAAEPAAPSKRREWSARRRRFKRCSSGSRWSPRPKLRPHPRRKRHGKGSSPGQFTSIAAVAMGRSSL